MKVKTWGHAWHLGIPHSRDYCCIECGDSTLKQATDFFRKCKRHIIGFDSGEFAAIFRCPKCESIFWFHLNLDVVENFFSDFDEPV